MTLAMVKVLPEPVTPQQGLVRQPVLQSLFQATNSLGLIPGRTESRIQFKRFTHGRRPDDRISGR